MGFVQRNRKVFNKLRTMALVVGELKGIYHRKDEWKQTVLTKEQSHAAKEYMKKHYGKVVPLWWHRLYTSYTGKFDEKYFPEILFSSKLEEKLNPYDVALPLGNKAFNPQILFRDIPDTLKIRTPEYLCVSCYGVIWNRNDELVDFEWIIANIGVEEHVIKPTIDTMGAKGVQVIKIEDGIDVRSKKRLADILKSYGGNFVIQERVKNHTSIAHVYPNSVNSLRVITYICDNQIHIAPLSMRFGINGRVVDNAGIFIGVDKEGYLCETGFSKKGLIRYSTHPDTGVVFKGYKVAGVPQMIDAAHKMHARLPQLKMISWDLAYDDNENVVIIEVNTTGQSVWFPQMVNGEGLFGDHTPQMYHLIRK